MTSYEREIAQLKSFIDEFRRIRERTCDPKNNANPRYHALSSATSQIDRAIEDAR
jgi:hypothetical protein